MDPEHALIVVKSLRDIILLIEMMDPDEKLITLIAARLTKALVDIAKTHENNEAPA